MEEFSQSLDVPTPEKPDCVQPFQRETSQIAQAGLKQTLALTLKYQEQLVTG